VTTRNQTTYFPDVADAIVYEGPASRNPLAFKHYDPTAIVGTRTMAEHFRFAVCYWHTFRATGADPFGAPTMMRVWEQAADPTQRALDTMDAAFEFMTKLGTTFWCFHDRDIAPDGATFAESLTRLERVVRYAEEKQRETGIQLLWGTANLFSHPRYMSGAATNPDPRVFAYAAAQVKHAMDATHALGGLGYVFWGGREGYDTLLNTNLRQEREQYARLLWMAIEYAKTIGFTGQLYIEPKPKEPTTHQYDSTVEACLNFLREFDLLPYVKLNIETNHATLAGHTMAHELQVARAAGVLGSIDANTGDELLGWDTDQFPTNVALTTQIMLEVLRMGGFTTGGLNFDAKVRRASIDPSDLFYAHVGAMDAFARGLRAAQAIVDDGRLDTLVVERYGEWDSPLGRAISGGTMTLADCAGYAATEAEPPVRSGRQEYVENLFGEYIFTHG